MTSPDFESTARRDYGSRDYHNSDSAHVQSPVEQVRNAGGLARTLATQFTDLIRQELALARAEMSESADKIKTGVIAIATGFVLALAALIILLDAIVYGLANSMPLWVAAAIVGGVVVVLAAIFIGIGQSRLSGTSLLPNRTARNVQRDAEMVKDKM